LQVNQANQLLTVTWRSIHKRSYDIDTSLFAIHEASRMYDWRKSATFLHM